MGKEILLTWVTSSGKEITEHCTLIDENDSVFVPCVDGKVLELPEIMSSLMEDGMVMFEDTLGLFGLPPSRIICVEEI